MKKLTLLLLFVSQFCSAQTKIVEETIKANVQKKVLSQSVEQYANENGITPQTVMMHLRKGNLGGYKIGKNWRVEVKVS